MIETYGLIKRVIHKVSEFAFKCAAILLLIMGLAVSYDVIMRYFFGSPTIWVNEISGYLLVIITFLSASHTLKIGGHVKVDMVENFLSEKGRKFLFLITHFLILFFVVTITWKGAQMVWMSWDLGWSASTLLKTPLFIPQLFIPMGGLLLTFETLVIIIDKLIEKNVKDGVVE